MLVLFASIAILVYRWSHTPYGILDYKLAAGLKLIYEPPDTLNFTPQQLRQQQAEEASTSKEALSTLAKVKDTVSITNQGPVPLRIYIPESTRPLPVIVYYHGGGFVFGTLNEYDALCARLAHDIPAMVISVAYRLAPEHPYPAAVTDAYAAFLWTYEHAKNFGGDSTRMAVMGDSAGGNLAAVVAQMARDLQGPSINYQVLLYPPTNSTDHDTDSYKKFGKGFGLTRDRVIWYTDMYLPHINDRYEPYASPLLATDFRNLPPALIMVAGFDPLRDEGQAYGEKLKNAGVPTQLLTYPDVVHGFISVELLEQREKALRLTTNTLQQVFGSGMPVLKERK